MILGAIMGEFPWEKKEEKKRGLLGLLALLGPHGRLLTAFLGLAGVFMGASLVLFHQEGDQPSDTARLSALISSKRGVGQSAPTGPAPVSESPLPLPGILKQEQTTKDDKTGSENKTAPAEEGAGAQDRAAQDEDRAAAERNDASGLGPLRNIRDSSSGKGGAFSGKGSDGGRGGANLPEKKGWAGNSKPGYGKVVKSGTYTNTSGGKNCSANANDIPELRPMWNQLAAKRVFLQANGCGDTPCSQCKSNSKDCTCALVRCEADRLYYKINSRLCGASTAE